PALERWIDAQAWPGNVRELKSLLDVALVLADGAAQLELEHLPPIATPAAATAAPAPQRLDDLDDHVLRRALADPGGNVTAVAAALGVARSTVYRMLRR